MTNPMGSRSESIFNPETMDSQYVYSDDDLKVKFAGDYLLPSQ